MENKQNNEPLQSLFFGHVLESNFGRRPKPSGTALKEIPFHDGNAVMEVSSVTEVFIACPCLQSQDYHTAGL